jgi:hypothetical protein
VAVDRCAQQLRYGLIAEQALQVQQSVDGCKPLTAATEGVSMRGLQRQPAPALSP